MSHGRFRMSDGDWVCSDPECANVNFARRTSCNRCNKDKPARSSKNKLGTEIGKAAAERSRGLFSAEDWQCSKCGNINWARRHTCNMCNSPKVGDLEERTGYGGGFNERGRVEYIHRDESDGEYDEFGRKKKKFRGRSDSSSNSRNEIKESSRDKHKEEEKHEDSTTKDQEIERKDVENDDEEEEEEEEDDDDDNDVSKYDLSGWGDDSDTKESNQNDESNQIDCKETSQNEETNSRSRSPNTSEKNEETRARSRSPIQKS